MVHAYGKIVCHTGDVIYYGSFILNGICNIVYKIVFKPGFSFDFRSKELYLMSHSLKYRNKTGNLSLFSSIRSRTSSP